MFRSALLQWLSVSIVNIVGGCEVMTKIVLGKKDKIDVRTTLEDVTYLDSVTEVNENQKIVFTEDTETNLSAIGTQKQAVYIPAHQLTAEQEIADNVHVYFDLENYPFYQAAKKVIEKEPKPKGVFRYRRMVEEATGEALFASDLYILASLLGEPEDIKVKKTDAFVLPAHIIVLVNFGGGTMAHIEYTISNDERIEFEWSGTKNIIDFDSVEMTPVQPNHYTALPLTYSVDSIVSLAHTIDQSLVDQLNQYKQLISGGAQ